jgi:hypothetical protein
MRLNLEKGCESIVNLFSDSLKLKRLSSDHVHVTLIKMVLNRRLFIASVSLFSNQLDYVRKRHPSGVFFLCFSNSLNMKNHRSYLLWAHKKYIEGVFHHVLLITFSSPHLWINVGSMLLSIEPLKHALYASLVVLCFCDLKP